MLVSIAALFLATQGPAERMTNACVDEGNSRAECACYAQFIKENTTEKELNALAILADPRNRQSAEGAMAALLAAGLTPNDLMQIGLKAQQLQGKAEAQCARYREPKTPDHAGDHEPDKKARKDQ